MNNFSLIALAVLLVSTTVNAAKPDFKSHSCVVEMKEFDTKKNQSIPEKDSDHTYESIEITWVRNGITFSLQNRNTKATNLANWDFFQELKQTDSRLNSRLRIDDVETKYFYQPKDVQVIESRRRDEVEEIESSQIITDVSRNRAKIFVTTTARPDGSIEIVREQRDRSAVDGNGIQVLSRKSICRIETISQKKVKFQGRLAKIKSKVDAFSKAMDQKSDSELIKEWRALFKTSDFRSEAHRKNGGKSTGNISNRCDRLEGWFSQCIYHRANCWEYNPGGYCAGAPSAWGQCTGRRPPTLDCR